MKLSLALLCLCLCGCSSTIKVPANSVLFQTPYGKLQLIHPQNTDMTNVSIAISTNGTITANIGALHTINSAEVIDRVAAGQAALVKANGEAMVNGINAAANAAGVLAGAGAKTMVK